jgi:hypothetical protein
MAELAEALALLAAGLFVNVAMYSHLVLIIRARDER